MCNLYSYTKPQDAARKLARVERDIAGNILPTSRRGSVNLRLFQTAGNAGEGRGKVGANCGHAGDDHHRDERGDQAIFNGSCAAFVRHKSLNQ